MAFWELATEKLPVLFSLIDRGIVCARYLLPAACGSFVYTIALFLAEPPISTLRLGRKLHVLYCNNAHVECP